ncbi:MAG: hypothetical protein KIS62_12390 [Ramlibacter sp.]|nr:hypothetical protein [Ramlibacter sp.]MCW5650537.1 hypothetical protein [Ramlibacter sp.]
MDEMKTLLPLHAVLPRQFPERLRDIAEQLYLQLLAEDLFRRRDDRATLLARLALRQTERLSAELGGHNMYIHKGVSYRLAPRNLRMRAEFRGDYTELARKYKLSDMQVRNIVDAQQLEEFRRNQRDMFPADEPAAPARTRRRSAPRKI